MNFRHDNDSKFWFESLVRKKHILNSNAYFDSLESQGYQFNIYQTSHLDFCQSNRTSTKKCWNYVHPNVLTIRDVPSATKRFGMLAKVLIGQSRLLSEATRDLIGIPPIAVYDPEVFEVLQADLTNSPTDSVFFAHVLLPHGPFVYTHDCKVSYDSNPDLSYPMLQGEENVSQDIVEYRTMRYFEQAECALKSLSQIFDQMRLNQIFDVATIVIHGDHGSAVGRNLPTIKNIDILSAEDYRAFYSTLFAVKLPGGKYAIDSRNLPLSTLLEEFNSNFIQQNEDGGRAALDDSTYNDKTSPFIYLRSVDQKIKVDIDIFEN